MSDSDLERPSASPAGEQAEETPYERLRQLAGAIRNPSTPSRPRQAGASTSTRRGLDRTPASGSRTPALNRPSRPAPAKMGAPTTPHAIRALQQRRAAAAGSTPGRDRRRSGRQERETPRDILRQLSKIEAPRTRPILPSPDIVQRPKAEVGLDEVDSDTDFARPSLTLPIDDDDDDSFQAPPRMSGVVEDETQTQLSIEGPRRDFTDQALFARDRVRASDRFGDLDDMPLDDFTQGLVDDLTSPGDLRYDGAEADLQGGITEDLQGILADRSGPLNDPSLQNQVFEEGDSTFAFDIPADTEEVSSVGEDSEAEADVAPPEPELNITGHEKSRPNVGKQKPKLLRKTRYGIPYPSMPAGVVKKITTSLLRSSGNSKTKVNSDILNAVIQSSDWFFEQMGDDLGVYAEHARRKTVDETDVITLMKRQRLLNVASTPFSLAQKYLPAELLQGIRMTRPPPLSKGSKAKLQSIVEEDEDDE